MRIKLCVKCDKIIHTVELPENVLMMPEAQMWNYKYGFNQTEKLNFYKED